MVNQINSPKFYRALDFVNKHVSSDTQRLIMGVTAIATQPLIDLQNTKVDDETRWTSAMRTVAKIVVGTTVGVFVRHYAIKLAKNNPCFWRKAGDKAGIPAFPGRDFWDRVDFSNPEHRRLNGYANTVGTIIGTGTGLITNFIIDAPLTKLMTNYLNENVKPVLMCKKNEAKEAEDGLV